MKSFAAFLRRLFLALFLLSSLAFCINALDRSTDIGRIVFWGMIGSGAAYFAIALLSVLLKSSSQKKMDEYDSLRDSFLGAKTYYKNGQMINFFRRIAFWGTIMLLVFVFALKTPITMFYGGPYSNDIFLRGYHGFLSWSLIAFALLFILTILYFVFYLPHAGEGAYSTGTIIGKTIIGDIILPFTVIKNFFSKSENGKRRPRAILSFAVMIVFVAVSVIAIVKGIR